MESGAPAQEHPRVFAHRVGWTEPKIVGGKTHTENSLPRATETLSKLGGCEIDVGFTSDGIAVITHDNVSKLTFEQFKQRYPDHATLESWINWFDTAELKDKQLYIDLKGTDQDSYQLLELVKSLGERISVGSKDPQTVFKLLLARKLLSATTKIYLQIPDPVLPWAAIEYANKFQSNIGLTPDKLTVEEQSLVGDLKPDGLHFYFPENLAKEIVAEISKHGDFYSAIDSLTTKKYRGIARIVPNLLILHDIQRARLELFTRLAKAKGYEVVAGSTANPVTMERMIRWGVDALMPNNPDVYLKHFHHPDQDQPLPPSPREQFVSTKDIFEHDLRKELASSKQSDQNRTTYLRLATKTHPVNAIRQQIGI